MKKKLIRLTESDLHRIVKESVNRVVKEAYKIDDEIDLSEMKDRGSIPYIIAVRKALEDCREKVDSIYDRAYQYYDLNGGFENSSKKEFEQYYWGMFEKIFDLIHDDLESLAGQANAITDQLSSEIEKTAWSYPSRSRLMRGIHNNEDL